MYKYEMQSALFAAKLSRNSLNSLELSEHHVRLFQINVWRNHAFEPLLPLLKPYCVFGGWWNDFQLGAYDDSLMFTGHSPADLELLWLDSDRFIDYSLFSDWLAWLEGRLQVLRSLSNAPIILATWVYETNQAEQIQNVTDQLPAVFFANLQAVCEEENVSLLDKRTAAMAGTPISSTAQLVLSRKFACHWMPALLFPPIKSVALDLDNTLYAGVLGEDGVAGVVLTPGHLSLQKTIKSLQQRGVFIALVSRNVKEDVKSLFEQRLDFPLRWEDFSVTEVSWGDKADALERIAKKLRIGLDAIMFVDDNLGELTHVSSKLSQIQTVFAHSDASITKRVIEYYPGLWRWKTGSDDTKRIIDLKANSEREAIADNCHDPAEYFRSLQISLTYIQNEILQIERLTDLCNKTNQFNLSLQRFNQVQIAQKMNCRDSCVVGVQLSDRLSDSGIIAAVFGICQGEQLVVEELCISCRALGRQLENTIILYALRTMPFFDHCKDVVFNVQHGPRNQPALEWLKQLSDLKETPIPGAHAVPADFVSNFMIFEGIKLNKE